MSVTVTVNGQSGPSLTATSGDVIEVTVSPAGTPGGTGPQGPQGAPYTVVEVGNTTTLAAGSNAAVTGTSTNSGANLTLNFSIPAGPAGATGAAGITPTFKVGSVSTLAAGSNATVTATTANNGANVTLSFGLPKGADGTGTSNLTLSTTTPAALGVAAVGTGTTAARSDHVHQLPVIAYANLSGVPANFPTNVTLVSGLAGLYLGASDAVDGGNYVGEPFSGITFTTQPQSQTLTLSSAITWTSAANAAAGLSLHTRGAVVYAIKEQNASEGLTNGTLSISQVANAAALNAATYANVTTSLVGSFGGNTLPPTAAETTLANVGNVGVAMASSHLYFTDSNGTNVYTWGRIARTTNNGSTWGDYAAVAAALNGTGFVPWSIAANDFGFVVAARVGSAAGASVTGSANLVLQSADGTNWNQRSLPASRPWLVAGGGPRFVAVSQSASNGGASTNAIYSIDNGVSWTNSSTAFVADASPAYGNSRFVAVHNSTAYMTLNGSSWASSNLPAGGSDYRRVSYAGGRFFAFRESNTTDVAISTDGQNWTLGTLPSAQNWAAVGAAGNYFAAVGNTTTWASGEAAAATGSANFTVAAVSTTGANVSYQWQASTDAGTTWSNVANATASTLNLSGLTLADSGKKYRAVGTATGATPATSQSATLTVVG